MVWREPTTRSNTYHGNESSSSNDYGNNGGKPPYVNYNRSASTRGNEHRDNSYRAKGEGFSGDSAGGEKPREYSSSYTRPPRPAFSTESGAWGKRPGNKPDDTSKEKEKAPSTTAHSSTSSTNAWRNAPTASKIATGSTPSSAETETSGAAAGSVSKASTGDGKPAATGEVWSRAPKAVKQGSE